MKIFGPSVWRPLESLLDHIQIEQNEGIQEQIEVPFEWDRDYGPFWEPGSKAFWLEPKPEQIRPGVWPMPFTARKDMPIYNDEDGEWYHEGVKIRGFFYSREYKYMHYVSKEDGNNFYISDFDLGLASRKFSRSTGYLGREWWDERQWEKYAV